MNKIKVKEIINKAIGEELLSMGFQYDGYHDSCWEYCQKDDPFLTIQFDSYRFESNMIRLTVFNKYLDQYDTSELVIKGRNDDKDMAGFFHYNNEEELENILQEMLSYSKEKGIPQLEKQYYSKKSYNEEDLNNKLYERHSELFDNFLKEHEEILDEESGFDIDNLLSYIENRLEEIHSFALDEAINEILVLASVLGEFFVRQYGGEWTLVDLYDEKRVLIDYIKTEIDCYYILNELLKVYRGEQSFELIKEDLEIMQDTNEDY